MSQRSDIESILKRTSDQVLESWTPRGQRLLMAELRFPRAQAGALTWMGVFNDDDSLAYILMYDTEVFTADELKTVAP